MKIRKNETIVASLDEFESSTFVRCNIQASHISFIGCRFIECVFTGNDVSFKHCKIVMRDSMFDDVRFECCMLATKNTTFIYGSFTGCIGYPIRTTTFKFCSFADSACMHAYKSKCMECNFHASDSFKFGRKNKCRLCKSICQAKYCNACLRHGDYSRGNEKIVGKITKLPSFSFEYEVNCTQQDDIDHCMELVEKGFMRTSDCSVTSEYKSPIYLDMKAFSHHLNVMEKCSPYVNRNAMTHVHIGTKHKYEISENYYQIIKPLELFLVEHRKSTIQLFGNYFYDNAHVYDRLYDRYHWFDLATSFDTIEIRICAFRSKEQYRRIVTFLRSMMAYINTSIENAVPSVTIGQEVLAMYKRFHKKYYDPSLPVGYTFGR